MTKHSGSGPNSALGGIVSPSPHPLAYFWSEALYHSLRLRELLRAGSVKLKRPPAFVLSLPLQSAVPGRDTISTSTRAEPQEERRRGWDLARKFRSRPAALLLSQREPSRSSPPPLPAYPLRPRSRSRPERRRPVFFLLGPKHPRGPPLGFSRLAAVPRQPTRLALSTRQPRRSPCAVSAAGPGPEPEQ